MTGNTKNFPGFDHVYKMARDFGKKILYADLEDGTPQTELLRGEWVPETALQAHWSMERAEPSDVALGCTSAWLYLSPRVQQLFRDHNFTGWSTYPIILHNKAGEVCPGYAGLSITGRCGPIDEGRGAPVPEHLRKPGTPDLMGMYFDESTWDGSDFFCPAGNNSYKFVTEAVKSMFEEHKIHGFEFTPLTKAMYYI